VIKKEANMFERFTDEARQVLVRATDVAKELKSPHIRRHHMLIGLLDGAESSELVGEVFDAAQVDRPAFRARLLDSLKASEEPDLETGSKPFSGGAKKALELALREALSLGHNYVASFHLLLAILRGADGPLEDVVGTTGLDYDTARALVRKSAPERRRGGRSRRGIYGRTWRGRGTKGLDLVLISAHNRAGRDREATTGDLLVALAETPGTHFATILGASLPALATITAEADRLIAAKVADGEPDSLRVDPKTGAVTATDPKTADALRKLAESGQLRAILDQLGDDG
jgi:ATP-dependent Clp protease ATP-binding subunit ClpA